jgi:hypothetical protein
MTTVSEGEREVLELAAKAAGYRYVKPHETYGGQFGLALCDEHGRILRDWDPLHDDGDALRLLARLRLTLDYRVGFVGVHTGHGPYIGQCPHDAYPLEDDTAATRRAIVRAAASIGKDNP